LGSWSNTTCLATVRALPHNVRGHMQKLMSGVAPGAQPTHAPCCARQPSASPPQSPPPAACPQQAPSHAPACRPVHVCVWVCVCGCARVCACVCVCVRVRRRACMCVRVKRYMSRWLCCHFRLSKHCHSAEHAGCAQGLQGAGWSPHSSVGTWDVGLRLCPSPPMRSSPMAQAYPTAWGKSLRTHLGKLRLRRLLGDESLQLLGVLKRVVQDDGVPDAAGGQCQQCV